MAQSLQGKRVAILIANGFEQAELTEPRQALQDAGAETQVVSPEQNQVKGWNKTDWGDTVVLWRLMETPHSEDPRRLVDTDENALYWRFVWLSWLPIYALIYWVPRLFR